MKDAVVLPDKERLRRIEAAARSVGKAVISPLLIIIISFVPILFLTGQEEKLFSPLAWTKTFALLGAALVSLTVVPAAMTFLVKGKMIPEERNPAARFFVRLYRPLLRFCLRWKKSVLALCAALALGSVPLVLSIGKEFMPPLDEGSILFMPTLMPDVSNAEAQRILQVQDRILKSFPEVENVLGKAGRAYTATDNAPISMFESIILLKPRRTWRKGLTKEKLIVEMDQRLQIPGVVNAWTQPIINRINMLSTGVRSDVAVKIFGPNLDTLYDLGRKIEQAVQDVPGLSDLYVEQITGGRFLDIRVRRGELGRYGLSVDDVNGVVEAALGGMNLTQTVEGRRRFQVNMRLGQDFRDDLEKIRRVPILTAGGPVALSQVADVELSEGPAMINSENAMLRGTVLFNARGRDMGGVANDARKKVEGMARDFPQGYFVTWSGQYENQLRAEKRLRLIIPIVLLLITLVIYFTFRSWKETVVVLAGLPISLVGGAYILYFAEVNFSVAVAVGFIALFGIAVETGVLVVIYLNNAVRDAVARCAKEGRVFSAADLDEAVVAGGSLSLRPVLMTSLANLLGLLPVLFSQGPGSDLMKPLILPFESGLFTALLFAFIVLPVMMSLLKHWEMRHNRKPVVLNVQT